MNILLFGKTGQVGWELQRALAPLGNLIALDVHSTDYCGDFSNPEGVAETVKKIRPDVIVNAAAHTAVDKAESEPKFAQLLNATSVEAIAKAANEVGAWVIHYSTDYVFPGNGDTPWLETDATAPLNVYGETKLAGEKALQEHCAKHLIFRTSWVYAGKGNNFAKTMLRLAKEREELAVINDQFGAPTGLNYWLIAPLMPFAWPQINQKLLVCTIWLLVVQQPGTIMPLWYLKKRAERGSTLLLTNLMPCRQRPIPHQHVVPIILASIPKNFSRTLRLSCLTGRWA